MSTVGNLVAKSSWGKRHTFITIYNLFALFCLALVGALRGSDLVELISRLLLIFTFIGLAASTRINHLMRSLLSGGAVLVTSAGLVSVTEGNLLAHFSFIIAIVILASYREVLVYFMGILVIFTYYLVLGFWDPELIITNHNYTNYAILSILLATIVLTGGASAIGWLLDNDSDRDNQALKAALDVVSLRQRQAIQIHDDVIQGLVVAQYAIDTDDNELAYRSLTKSLTAAKELVGNLLLSEETDLATLISRDDSEESGAL